MSTNRMRKQKPPTLKPCECRCGCQRRTDLAIKVWRRQQGFWGSLQWLTRHAQVCDRCMYTITEALPAREVYGA
jgi:hypothetical protein